MNLKQKTWTLKLLETWVLAEKFIMENIGVFLMILLRHGNMIK